MKIGQVWLTDLEDRKTTLKLAKVLQGWFFYVQLITKRRRECGQYLALAQDPFFRQHATQLL